MKRLLCLIKGGHFWGPWTRGVLIEYRFCNGCPAVEHRDR